MKIITFLSDFGTEDWFVSAVKGEILKIKSNAIIIDITHELPQFDIHQAAFLLKSVYKNFPRGTVHLAVIDPGVGSERRPIIVKSSGYYFVGPDNGIFSYIYNKNSTVYEIMVNKSFSATFHARDIFGPTAAKLSNDSRPEDLGRRVKDYTKFEFPEIEKKRDKIYGEIVYIDHFGNLITNIPNEINIKEISIIKKKIAVKKAYSEGLLGEIICIKGSCGYYEIACNQKSVRDILRAKIGMKIVLSDLDKPHQFFP